MKRLILILLVILTISSYSQDLKYASFNILTNSIIGGIGSGIHKKSGETFGHAFVQGMWKGAASGALNYGSKKMLQVQVANNKLDWRLCWGSKLVNSVSNTMLYNATMNERDFIGNYSINIGFLRFSTKYKVQVEPVSLGYFTFLAINKSYSFNIEKSLKTGSVLFKYTDKNINNKQSGFSLGNIASYFNYEKYVKGIQVIDEIMHTYQNQTIIHEIIHTYQNETYYSFNSYFSKIKPLNKIASKLGKYIYLDAPYNQIHYFIESQLNGYNNNYFELEADWK